MEFLKRWEFLFASWLSAFLLLMGTSIFTYQIFIDYQKQNCLANLELAQESVYKGIDKKEVFLNLLAEKAYLDPATRLPCDLTIYIYNTKRQLLKTTDPLYNQLPSTKNINDLLLIAPLSNTPQWATVNGLNRAKPEIFYIFPLLKEEKLEAIILFRFQNAQSLIEEFLGGVDRTFFTATLFTYKEGVGGPIQYTKDLEISPLILEKALSGSKLVLQKNDWFGIRSYGVFYLPNIKFGFVFEKISFFSILLILQVLGLGALVVVAALSYLTNFYKIFSVFTLFLGIGVFYLGALNYWEQKELLAKKKAGFIFDSDSTVVMINQYIEEFRGVLDSFVTFKYQLKQTNEEIQNKLDRYNILAVNFYENPVRGIYKNTSTLTNSDWKPTSLIPLPYKEEYKIEGPITDPLLGSIFIFSTQKNVDNQGTTSIVIDAKRVNNILEMLIQEHNQPFVIVDPTGHPIYQYKDLSKVDVAIEIPAGKWVFKTQNLDKLTMGRSNSLWISFLFIFGLFFCAVCLLIYLNFETIFSLSSLPVVSSAIIVWVIIFQLMSYQVLQQRINTQCSRIYNQAEEIQTQIESIRESYNLLHDEPMKIVPVKLRIDRLGVEGVDKLNATGSFVAPLRPKTKLFIYTSAKGTVGIEGIGDETPVFYFNNDFIDNSQFREFPFNPGNLNLPLQATTVEKILFVPDLENLEELSKFELRNFNFRKIGCRYKYIKDVEIPILEYEFIFDRGVMHVMACYLLPLLIGLSILYQSFITRKVGDELKTFVPVWGSVMFITVLMYVSFRGYLGNRVLSFLENIYIGSFLLLVGVQVLSLIEKFSKDEKFFVHIRYFYWPAWAFISMIVTFLALI
jgi:hypothetical protein